MLKINFEKIYSFSIDSETVRIFFALIPAYKYATELILIFLIHGGLLCKWLIIGILVFAKAQITLAVKS